MHGFLLVDKDAGRTSCEVCDAVKWLTGQRRVGHTGTLDPHATGLLLLALGRATKAIPFVQDLTKRYLVTVRLGARTDTDDMAGRVLEEKPVPPLDADALRGRLAPFVGEIEQRPPAVSAVHVDGERAYRRVRRGEDVDLAPRKVRVEGIDLVGIETPLIHLDVRCGSGTYMRSLARDLGDVLGCGGAVDSLRRLAIGSFRVEDALAERDLAKEGIATRLRTVDDALSIFPAVELDEASARRFTQGQIVDRKEPAGRVRVRGPAGFLGVGEVSEAGLKTLRVIVP